MQLDLSPHARSPLSFHFYLCPFLFWNIHHRYFVTTNPNLLLFFFLFLTILRPSSSSEIPSTVALRSLGRSESHYSSPKISEHSQAVPSTSNPFSPVYHRRKFFNDEKKKTKKQKKKVLTHRLYHRLVLLLQAVFGILFQVQSEDCSSSLPVAPSISLQLFPEEKERVKLSPYNEH
jgi:hypothetical protein